MKINNNEIEVIVENGTVQSIKYKNKEILYQKTGSWKKTFPIIFPQCGNGVAYTHKGKKYDIPKHGFWNDIEFEEILENGSLVSLGTVFANNEYPFSFDIKLTISIIEKKVVFQVSVQNISNEKGYFQFGFHPAFNIEKESYISLEKNVEPQQINLDGSLSENEEVLDKINLMDMPFGKSYDTLTFRKNKPKNVSLINKEEMITFWTNLDAIQIWKTNEDSFVCIEPWQGYNDTYSKDVIAEVADKKEIIAIDSGKVWSGSMTIEIEEIAKKDDIKESLH